MATSFSQTAIAPGGSVTAERRRYLFGPVLDFLTFGGLSLLVLPLLLLLPSSQLAMEKGIALAMMISHAINHPHFAHSYQLFYRQFAAKASGAMLDPVMRARYLFAGLGVPLALAGFFSWCFVTADGQLLGQSGNIMALFVGWHYVKQGYGLLMTDCALKRQFFDATDKKVLLANCYASWAATWLLFNAAVDKIDLLGLSYYSFAFPGWLVNAGIGASLATTLAAAGVFLKAWRNKRALPLNGVLAYFASIYPWMLVVGVSSWWVLFAPAFHSLQYLAVVWRFEANRERAAIAERQGSLARHVIGFVTLGIVLGFLGFAILPGIADSLVGYDTAALGPTAFAFAALIFINVHHYFIDNVIWRRDNPEAQRFLFS